MQIKTMMRYHYIPIRMTKKKKKRKLLIIPVLQMGNNRNSYALLVGMQNGTGILENTLAVPYKIKYTHHMTQQSHPQVILEKLKLMFIQKPIQECLCS